MTTRVTRRIRLVDRSTLVLAAALGAFGLGAAYRWYSLPPLAVAAFAADLAWVRGGQGLSALGAVAVAIRLARPARRPARGVFWVALAAGLLFPYLVATWSIRAAYLASELYSQEMRMIKHVEDSFPFIQSQWKRGLVPVPSSPVASALPIRVRENRFFQLASWNRVVDG